MAPNVVKKIFSLAAALCFVVVFSVLGVRLLTWSKAATPPSENSSCAPSASMPASGCHPFLGVAINRDPWIANGSTDRVTQFNALDNDLSSQLGVNHPLQIFRDYVSANTTANPVLLDSDEQRIVKQNPTTYLDINWLPAVSWADADGGDQAVNNIIAQSADNVKAVGNPVFISMPQEPEHDVTGFDVGSVGAAEQSYCNSDPYWKGFTSAAHGGTPAQYIGMWQNVENIFKAHGVTNVIWTFDNQSYPALECLVPMLWPGQATTINWLFYDTYGRAGTNNSTFDDTAGQFYTFLKNLVKSNDPAVVNAGKQIVSIPWGLGEMNDCVSDTAAAQYWDEAATAVKSNSYPNLKLYMPYTAEGPPNYDPSCLVNTAVNGSSITNDLTGAKFQSFKGFVQATLGSSSTPIPTVTLTSPHAGSTVSGSVAVAATATVSSGSITSLVLKSGGTTLKTCPNTGSCSAAWDTTALANGSYTLEADTMASDGNTNTATESVTVSNSHPVTISPPSSVSSPSQTTTSIALTWKASVDSKYPANQLTYQVYRNGARVGSTAAGVTSYTDSGLSPGTYYSYTLAGTDPLGNTSDASAAFTQKTQTPNCAKPAAPTNFSGSATTPTSIDLTWTAVPNPSSSCVILHYVVARNNIPLAQPGTTSYSDTTVTPSTTYEYTVLAVETGNLPGPSTSVHVTTPPNSQPDPGPSTPTNVTATAVSDTQVNLTWSASRDPVTGIKSYNVIRNGQVVGTSTTTSFGDSGLTASTQYSYAIQAVSGGNKTSTSATVNATTLPSQNQGGGNNQGGNSTPVLPPILQGTQSVGTGSDSGQTSSDNPTDPGSSTTSQLEASPPNAATSHSLTTKTVAYVGGSSVLVIVLIAAGYWFILRPRRLAWHPVGGRSYDPDFSSSSIVVGDSRGVQQQHDDKQRRG